MVPGQDWCLQCGAGAPGSIGTPGWRSAATVLAASAILALGAAAAAYAALSKGKPATHMVTATVAQVAPPATVTTPAPTTTETPTISKALPLPKIKTPKIPLTPTFTPKTPSTTTPTNTTTTKTGTTTTPATSNTGGSSTEPTAITLDTNAASTYNPYNYTATNFGDPSLTIDGATSTAWTALVEPTVAPRMAVGVLIDLKAHQKVGQMDLVTSTPGMTVQVYGTTGHTAPTSITDPAWIALNGPRVTKKKKVKMKLHDSSKAFYYVLLWVSKAPSTSTAAAPGHVSVNELELFPPE